MTELWHDPDRRLLVALLGTAAVAHAARPGWFVPMVPDWVPGDPEVVNLVAGAAEGLAAALLVGERTSRLGGALALAVLLGVFPANLEAVRRGGYDAAPSAAPDWVRGRAAAVLRLPLQWPPVAAAWRVSRR